MPYDIGIDARKLGDFGIGTYVHQLVLGLSELDRENRYHLLVGPAYAGEFDGLPANFERILEPAPNYSIREQLALSWRLVRGGLDLFHATHYVLPLLTPLPVVVTVHDIIHVLFPEFLPNRLAGLYARSMLRRSVRRSAALITDSQHTADDLARHFDAPRGKMHPIHPGVAERFFEALAPAEVRQHLERLGVVGPYVLFVGNPKPHKNLVGLLEGYARAARAEAGVPDLVCVGARGGEDAAARARAEDLGVAARVRWLGYVAEADLPSLYQGAQVLLHPALYEGFGLPVAEAMASGTAVITSEGSALGEVAGGAAETVDPRDPAAIAEALVRCVRDPEHRKALATRGQQRARAFSWRRAADQTLAIYRRVLEDTREGGGPR